MRQSVRALIRGLKSNANVRRRFIGSLLIAGQGIFFFLLAVLFERYYPDDAHIVPVTTILITIVALQHTLIRLREALFDGPPPDGGGGVGRAPLKLTLGTTEPRILMWTDPPSEMIVISEEEWRKVEPLFIGALEDFIRLSAQVRRRPS
ncbi:MAG: hypothetical protein WC802_03510 [Patescibacteria group bacterium]|jgi:hypothetical protein